MFSRSAAAVSDRSSSSSTNSLVPFKGSAIMIRLIDSFFEPERNRIPVHAEDLARITAQTFAAEEGPRVLRRIVHRVLDLFVRHDPLDLALTLEQIVEPLVGARIVVLEVEHLDLGIAPIEVLAIHIALDQALLDHPVDLRVEFHRIAPERLDDVLPFLENVLLDRIERARGGVGERHLEEIALDLECRARASVVHRQLVLRARVV